MKTRTVFYGVAVALALAALGTVAGAAASNSRLAGAAVAAAAAEPPGNVHHDVSPPLSSISPATPPPADKKKDKEPKKGLPVPAPSASDPVVQTVPGSAAAPSLGLGFEGVGAGFSGPQGAFTVTSAPPDPNSTVGPNHIVEIVNQSFAIFNKSGTPIYGPVPTNTLWSGFGGGCETNDDGDATVKYDQLANRWIFSQFSVSTTPYLQCVAVSTSGDPTGSYNRYSFQYGNFPDYPKLGVWPDAYYTTFNMFRRGNRFVGPEVCAYDRSKMLAGQAATQQCFALSNSYGSLLPSDLDGSTPPPSGSANYVLSFATNSLKLWKFHVDWTTPANSTLTGPATIAVAAFSPACSGGGTCIPQAGTTQQLDSLADRLMYRLAYRNFGDHESLVVDHSVTAGSSVGVRWYELRSPNGTPIVYQQGTYAPDASDRWMGSVAMDRNGDIALGFSVSSSSLHPRIHYTGRLAGDPLGTMSQGEGVLLDGAGSQTGGLSRWGDYTSMSVDPSDDCTFWYTDEYLSTNGSFNWHTRIGSFKLASCNDFSIGASPSSLSLAQGGSGTSTIGTAVTNGSAQTVSLSASGQPAGTTVSFNPASVTAGASSTMTVSVGSSTATGSYTITVTGAGTSATHSTTVGLTVNTAPLVVSGNEITDAVRALGVQGDGRTAPDSSFGIWEATTNLVPNGGFETNTSGWSAVSALLSRVTSSQKFGSASGQFSTSNLAANEGGYITFVASGSVVHTESAWVWRESGTGGTVRVRIADNTGTTIAAGSPVTLSTTPQRIFVTSSALTSGATYRAYVDTDARQLLTFNVDGVQSEANPVATPYVETNGGTASRSAARVQAPASLLNATQGWVAMRVRIPWANDAAPIAYPVFFDWADDANNQLYLVYEASTRTYMIEREQGGAPQVSQSAAQTFSPGDVVTLIAAWTATTVKLSIAGAAFGSVGGTPHIPTLAAALFDIGNASGGNLLDGDILWFACGTGTLTDTDAATIAAQPNNPFQASGLLPAAALESAVWQADTAAYTTP